MFLMPKLRRYCYGLTGNKDHGDDLLHNSIVKILEKFKFGRNRGEIRSDDLPIKEPGFLPTCLQHFGE